MVQKAPKLLWRWILKCILQTSSPELVKLLNVDTRLDEKVHRRGGAVLGCEESGVALVRHDGVDLNSGG